MDVFKAIKARRSVRNYTGKNISDVKMEKLLKAARDAPSAKNLQPWKFIVITEKRKLMNMVHLCRDQGFVADAGALLVGLTEDEKWAKLDLVIALDHLSLAAVSLGLGTCWIGAFDPEGMRKKLEVPDRYDITICMTVGHPAEEGLSPVKKNIDELVHWQKFGRKKKK